MDPNIRLREAAPEDLNQVEALVKTAYHEFKPLFPEQVWQAWMNNIKETVHAKSGTVIVAEDKGDILGVVKFYADGNLAGMGQWPPGSAAMRILAVHPASRGRGLGTRLAQECLRRARALNIPRIYLYTGAFMVAARHIYEKLGLKRAPELDRDPGPIAYRLDL